MFADEELVMELLINAGQANSDTCTGSFDECNIMPGFSQGNYFIKKRAPCLIFSPVRYLEEITTLLRISHEYKDA